MDVVAVARSMTARIQLASIVAPRWRVASAAFRLASPQSSSVYSANSAGLKAGGRQPSERADHFAVREVGASRRSRSRAAAAHRCKCPPPNRFVRGYTARARQPAWFAIFPIGTMAVAGALGAAMPAVHRCKSSTAKSACARTHAKGITVLRLANIPIGTMHTARCSRSGTWPSSAAWERRCQPFTVARALPQNRPVRERMRRASRSSASPTSRSGRCTQRDAPDREHRQARRPGAAMPAAHRC
jgi:hypothetical protein